MNPIVVWGASSGLGLAIVEYFSQAGFEVIGVARNPDKSPELKAACKATHICDATDQQQVEAVVNALPNDAWVISTMGSFRAPVPVDYIGHRYLIDALQEKNLMRFFLVTSLGCGDSWQFLSERARQGFGDAVREKSLAEAWLQSSDLDYTILRPGGLVNGPMTESGELSQGIEVHGIIHRSEVARLVHQLLDSPDSVGQVYACVDKQAVVAGK
ncbi:SDR family NAD(P)-dependent oxidoreductase [Thaumasiovibrio subtropicus]|uniref:SDR family NAD(P)-dependent oxidoreductase n=1 Tax=Thaumasiovibrio subtropicus TaxID=1891207 RepID=UPI000B360EE3|nr:SDR family NAD(P)-dependent oxidoreductase [Thaumasiovibrio subtropicus]